MIVSSSFDNKIILWNATSFKIIAISNSESLIMALAFSPND